MVIELSDNLCITYKVERQKFCEEDWPPIQHSSVVNLALIEYNDTRTSQELIKMSQLCKEGAAQVDEAAALSNVTKDIGRIFVPEKGSEQQPKRILIEGAPGIGKTVLAKEIAYKWANGKILIEYRLLFFLLLRDPRLSKVKSLNEILELFTSSSTSDLEEYVHKDDGMNIAFVFDGFDEYPSALRKESFIVDLIGGKLLSNSTVVVTSRPTATLQLQSLVDRRIEILGFPREERDRYISLSFRNAPHRKQELKQCLKGNPIIEKLCYHPLYLAILVYLCQENRLPDTLTKINESFIISTIYRNLERSSPYARLFKMPKTLEKFPSHIFGFVKDLSCLAFKGLQNNQLVFTIDYVTEVCPKINEIPGAINGFGLLQAVEHNSLRGGGSTTSVNFLHLTMQEFLAAFYVSKLSDEEQLSLMKEYFWESHLSFMWMMYIALVKSGGGFVVFKKFIASKEIVTGNAHLEIDSNIQMDKRKCLYLFQCYTEANLRTEMPEVIFSMFKDGNVVMTNIELLPHHVSSLVTFMSAVKTQQCKALELANCSLNDIGMNALLDYFESQNENIPTLKYVDLSKNNSSPWGVYCAIIKHCCVNSLTFCGDEGMKKYVNKISDGLQTNIELHSITLLKIGKIGVESMEVVLSNNITLKKLNMSWLSMSWKSEGTTIIHRKFTHSEFSSTRPHLLHRHTKAVDINILCDGDHEHSSEAVILSGQHIDDDAVYVIAFGLYNNTTVKKLDLSCNSITKDGVGTISDCLKPNNTLRELNLSNNEIGDEGGKYIADVIRVNLTLQKVDLSHNHISDDGVIPLSESLCGNNALLELNLSKNQIGDEGARFIIAKATQVNITLQKLDLSGNHISYNIPRLQRPNLSLLLDSSENDN